VLLNNYHFIFACKPLSHTHLYGWIDLLDPDEDIRTQNQRIRNAKGKRETHTLRYANDVPPKEGEGSLRVNWIEHIVVQGKKQTCKNAFVTDHEITEKNAMEPYASNCAAGKSFSNMWASSPATTPTPTGKTSCAS